jgi:hypothetical protein
MAQAKVCVAEVYNAPEAASLRVHSPIDPREATLTQLSDTSLASQAEINAIAVLHPRLRACQKAILESLSTSTPGVVPILAKAYGEGDDDLIRLIQKKMSWGERTRHSRDRINITMADVQAEGQRIAAGLQVQHESELARRQAALDAMARWSQTQQMINAMNRPVMTNCMNLGSGIVSCTSN